MIVADLFAGVGGLSQGFIKAGCEVAFAVEFDKEIADAYKKNHPNTEVFADTLNLTDTISLCCSLSLTYSVHIRSRIFLSLRICLFRLCSGII